MNTKHTTAIAIKLIAIYFLSQVVFAYPSIFSIVYSSLGNKYEGAAFAFALAFISVVTAVLVYITFKSLWKLADSALGNSSSLEGSSNEIDPIRIEKALFTVLGVYFIVTSFIDLTSFGTYLWQISYSDKGIPYYSYVELFGYFFQLLIGLSLIKRLDRWIAVIRAIGSLK